MNKQLMILYDGSYRFKNGATKYLALLANFLTDDIQGGSNNFHSHAESYKRWIKYSDQQTISGNRSFLDKHEGNIYIRDLYDEDCGILEDRYLILSPENLLEIIEQWKKICRTKPKQFTIVQADDGYVSLVASDS